MARLALVSAVLSLVLGCGGGNDGSGAVGELVLQREDDVYALDLESGEERRIGSSSQYGGFYSAWSPSGTKVANDDGGTIDVTTVATGDHVRLDAPRCSFPVWAPDETTLACENNEPFVISTLDVRTGVKRTLTEPSTVSVAPAWSPDSRSIAYVAGGIKVMERDGSGQHQVADAGDHERPAWSPDGDHIAYLSDGSVWIVNSGGGDRRLLLDGERRASRGLAWSPDGRSIAVTHGDGDFEIFVIDVTSGESRNLTDNEGVDDEGAVWSPHSRHVAYVSDDEDSPGVHVMAFDGGESRRVSDGVAILHWSSTG